MGCLLNQVSSVDGVHEVHDESHKCACVSGFTELVPVTLIDCLTELVCYSDELCRLIFLKESTSGFSAFILQKLFSPRCCEPLGVLFLRKDGGPSFLLLTAYLRHLRQPPWLLILRWYKPILIRIVRIILLLDRLQN